MKKILSCILVMVLLVSLAGCGDNKCTSIKLSTNDISLSHPGQTKGLSVKKNPADTTDQVSFESSNSLVAVVDKYGLITAVGAGNATITVTCGDAVAFCEVVVGSGTTNAPGNNIQQGGSHTDNPGEINTQPPEPVTVDCPDCGGNGGHTCKYCDGAYKCKGCGGSGVDPNADSACAVCGGDGMCSACSGTGKGYRGDCGSCGGTGDCTHCKGTGDERNSKYGWAKFVCPDCGGHAVCEKCVEGVIVCKTCGGEGTVTS